MSPMPLRSPLPSRFVRGVVTQPWATIDRGSYRPGYELTPQRLWIAYRQAEFGAPAMQCDAFEDVIEVDGHTRGQYLQRMQAVANRPIVIAPGGADALSVLAAEELATSLGDANVQEAIWHMMDSLFYGYSGTEIEWTYDKVRDLVAPAWFIRAEHRRFRFDDNAQPYLLTEENTWPGESLAPGKWIWSQLPARLPVRAGLMRTVAAWCLFKRLSFRDWLVFAELFGIPLAVGSYEERASDESRIQLRAALDAIGTDGKVMLADTTKLVIDSVMRGGDVASLHPKIIEMCNAEISKVITGATLVNETGGPGSFALGKVHQTRADALSRSDAEWIQNLFGQYVCRPFVHFNPRLRGARPPQLFVHVQPEMDPQTEQTVAEGLQRMGMDLSKAQLYRRFGFSRPLSTDDTLEPPKPEPPKGLPGKPGAKKPAKAQLAALRAQLDELEAELAAA